MEENPQNEVLQPVLRLKRAWQHYFIGCNYCRLQFRSREDLCTNFLGLYQICTLDRLLFNYPLGFSTKHEVQGVDMISNAENLQEYSEIHGHTNLI